MQHLLDYDVVQKAGESALLQLNYFILSLVLYVRIMGIGGKNYPKDKSGPLQKVHFSIRPNSFMNLPFQLHCKQSKMI